MLQSRPLWPSVAAYLAAGYEDPAFLFAPAVLAARARRFLDGFPGRVTYAVKANPDRAVLATLAEAGIDAFDVASAEEIRAVRALSPGAALHFHNPVKSREELRFAHAAGVRTYSVDCHAELEKIARTLPAGGVELSIRFRTEAPGAAYDFGTKFGATEADAAGLAARAAALGFTPSLTFHPGTQCRLPDAWRRYIAAAGRIAAASGARPARLNVGGGFPWLDAGEAPELEVYFETIRAAVAETFGPDAPALVCEPGRGMVAGCMALVCRVKLVREDGAVFLDDGIYGGLSEAPSLGRAPGFVAFDAEGRRRTGSALPRTVFGPTCDSLDRLPGQPLLPADLAEGDHVVVPGLGAYAAATATRFNGYGPTRMETVADFDGL